jgi:DNA polymerase
MAEAAVPREDLAALLRWYVDQGLDETIGEEAVDRLPPVPSEAVAAAAPPARAPTPCRTPAPPPRAPVPLESTKLVKDETTSGGR